MSRDARRTLGKVLWAAAAVLGLVGFLLFFSTFLSSAANFGDFTNFEERVRREATRAVWGMGLMFAAFFTAAAGTALVASGKTPPRGEPTDPAGSAAGPAKPSPPPPREGVKVRCPWCGSLNPEAAAACGECGGKL